MAETALPAFARELEAAGARLCVLLPGGGRLQLGAGPPAAEVRLQNARPLAALARRDPLALAEAYLAGELEVTGDWREALKVTALLDLEPSAARRLLLALRLRLPRRRWNRASAAFHYDRPPGFFLPWLERWRSYSHGFYATPDDDPSEAQARKLQFAIDALGLKPGMEVLDVGVGWGAFLEYAGLQGIRVHALTLSEAQQRFVEGLIRERRLPCRVSRVDFFDFRPEQPLAGAVFMGSLEHLIDYRRVAAFLARHLAPEARVYADFCAQRERFQVGAFLARHIWPGAATYVNVPALFDALLRAGLSVQQLGEDTASYGYTVRDWAEAFEAEAEALGRRFGPRPVRAFRLFLRASQVFFETDRTQAYHLVAGRARSQARAWARAVST
jgi:cyclopropane-fatty-acyl-phospholipid synthase